MLGRMDNTVDATGGYRGAGYLKFRLSSLVVAAETAAEDAELCSHVAKYLLIRDPVRERRLRQIAKAARLAADRAKDRAGELDWTGTLNATRDATEQATLAHIALDQRV